MPERKRIDFLHIIIEIGVITIGILIAYQLNNWNENRKQKASERNILKEIQSNLELDLIDLYGNQNGHESGLRRIDSLNAFTSTVEYDERTPIYIFDVFRDFLFIPQTSAFETLKAKGVDLITNDSLRIRILRLYDFSYTALTQLEGNYAPGQFHDDFTYIVDNYYLTYDINNPDSIKPKFRNSRWLKNPDVRTKLDLIKKERQFFNGAYKEVIEQVNSLIKAIDKELS